MNTEHPLDDVPDPIEVRTYRTLRRTLAVYATILAASVGLAAWVLDIGRQLG